MKQGCYLCTPPVKSGKALRKEVAEVTGYKCFTNNHNQKNFKKIFKKDLAERKKVATFAPRYESSETG